eukprot:TRINITY_DN38100_c0_g1_i1.p1 TRINITY_DN38100_c0_g1~~TRINITY_DN38100_c0_g1_i1.p1  ORF type:complete len:606 (-),score=160.90 TRINITY_DN38100_c0_g1_i1:305-2122(-)
MARVEVNASSRELVDLSAEAVKTLGLHLEQIGGIISGSHLPKRKGDRGAAQRVKEKLDLYQAYQRDVGKRQEEVEARLAADFEKMTAWRKEAGTEGGSLLQELEAYIARCRELDRLLKEEKDIVAGLRQDVADLVALGQLKDRKWASLAQGFVVAKESIVRERYMRAGQCSWLQCSFDNIRFRFKAQMEAERLRVEHHRNMRKNRAQMRLNCIKDTRERRMMQICVLAMQEEVVVARDEKLVEELRIRHDDTCLIMEGQIAQLLGDEEKAKEIVAEQVRRMEEARRKQREAEDQRDHFRREMRKAQREAEEAIKAKEEALEQKAEAMRLKEVAEADAEAAREGERQAIARAEKAMEDRKQAMKALRKAESEIKKKVKKIETLQRMLAELGAESDSDAPPDERAPPFFTNEDGSKVPRPRTRKERMGMAYREAESARCELRLGMAAMIDKDINNAQQVKKVQTEMKRVMQEILEVRWANQVLAADADAAAAKIAAFTAKQTQQPGDGPINSARSSGGGVYAPLMGPPNVGLAPSTAAVPPFSPTRPHFKPPLTQDGKTSPRLLVKSSSTPMMMPELYPEPPNKGKISLAPLRNVKRPPHEWQIGWH